MISDWQGCNESSGGKRSPAVATAPSPRPSGCRHGCDDRSALCLRTSRHVQEVVNAAAAHDREEGACLPTGEELRSRAPPPSCWARFDLHPSLRLLPGGGRARLRFPFDAGRARKTGWPKPLTISPHSCATCECSPLSPATTWPDHGSQLCIHTKQWRRLRCAAIPRSRRGAPP